MNQDGFVVRFEHAHADGTLSKIEFSLTAVAPYSYSVHAIEKAVGHGFYMNSALRFHFNNKHFKPDLDSVTELSFRLTDTLEVFGSSTANSAGNYIMWHEELFRT